MPRYNVTLNFSFEREYGEYDDYLNRLDIEDEEGSDADSDSGSECSVSSEVKRQAEAFRRTDAYYAKNSIEDHVKENDPLSFVENVICDGQILSAEWDEEKFQIHMVVETDLNKDELINDLEMTSLEDGEYEACGDTGWIVFTRGPKEEIFNGGLYLDDYWPYGLTDYRSNPIEVEEITEDA